MNEDFRPEEIQPKVTGPTVFVVMYRSRFGTTRLVPGTFDYADAVRLVKKQYPRTGEIHTPRGIFG